MLTLLRLGQSLQNCNILSVVVVDTITASYYMFAVSIIFMDNVFLSITPTVVLIPIGIERNGLAGLCLAIT